MNKLRWKEESEKSTDDFIKNIIQVYVNFIRLWKFQKKKNNWLSETIKKWNMFTKLCFVLQTEREAGKLFIFINKKSRQTQLCYHNVEWSISEIDMGRFISIHNITCKMKFQFTCFIKQKEQLPLIKNDV